MREESMQWRSSLFGFNSFEISILPKMTVDFSLLIKISFHRLFCLISQLRLICSSFEFRSYYDKSDDLWIDLENWEFLETQGNLAFYVTALLEYVHLMFLRIFLWCYCLKRTPLTIIMKQLKLMLWKFVW